MMEYEYDCISFASVPGGIPGRFRDEMNRRTPDGWRIVHVNSHYTSGSSSLMHVVIFLERPTPGTSVVDAYNTSQG